MKSCCVVGCGPAGMAACTALRRAGLLVTCFEINPTAGGIWAKDTIDTHQRGLLSPIPPSMRCAIPKDLMAFSDFSFGFSTPTFPHFSAVTHYLREYAVAKGINAITRFNTKVESVRFDEQEKQWKVISVSMVNGEAFEWSFDCVVVATGTTGAPRYPAHQLQKLKPWVEEQGGEVTHSAFLKNPRAYTRKKVVVVGDGVSAYDACEALQNIGASVVHSTLLSPEHDTTTSLLSARAWKSAMNVGDTKSKMSTSNNGDNSTDKGSGGGVAAEGIGRDGREQIATTNSLSIGLQSPRKRSFLRRLLGDSPLATLFATLPGWRSHQHHHSHEAVTRLLRASSTLRAIQRVGPLAAVVPSCEGGGLVFGDDPTRVTTTEDVIAAAEDQGIAGSPAKLVHSLWESSALGRWRRSSRPSSGDAQTQKQLSGSSYTNRAGSCASQVAPPQEGPATSDGRATTNNALVPPTDGATDSIVPTSTGAGSKGIFMSDVYAIIFATGYEVRMPFLPSDIRGIIEARDAKEGEQRQLEQGSNSKAVGGDNIEGVSPAAMEKPSPLDVRRHNLYRGVMYIPEPSLAFIGLPHELFPPFLLYEAQAAFIAHALTAQLHTPMPETVAARFAAEQLLLEQEPVLRDLFGRRGLGLHSSVYHDVLRGEAGWYGPSAARDAQTFAEALAWRQGWFLATGLISIVESIRALAPLKRKKQHILFSNKI